jgi:hypothetical protein
MRIMLMILLIVAALIKGEEGYILKHGNPLSPDMLKIAIELKINKPEGIRTLERGKIYGMSNIGGITLNRAIVLKKGIENKNEVIAHELVHVKQYQDAGSIYKFLKKYFKEVKKYGYYLAPMEVEARIKSELLLNQEEKCKE